MGCGSSHPYPVPENGWRSFVTGFNSEITKSGQAKFHLITSIANTGIITYPAY